MPPEPLHPQTELGLEPERLPRHIAIIMDGNGRWARQRNLPRICGHEQGAKAVRAIVTRCARLGIECLTLYSFSAENWKRPKEEVAFLMELYGQYLIAERGEIMENNVRLIHVGRRKGLPDQVLKEMDVTVGLSRNNTGLKLCLALNYGSRSEIVEAVRAIAVDTRDGKIAPEDIDEPMLQQHAATGMKLAHTADYAEAERFLSELVKRADAAGQPLEAEYWHMLGYVRMKQEKLVDAPPCYERALEIQPYYPEARGHLGYTLAALGRLDQATEQFAQLVRDDPQNGTTRASLGSVLARRGRIDDAVPQLLTAIEIDPESARVLVETAEVLRFQGRSPDALRLLRAGRERFPENVTLTVALIRMLAHSPDTAERTQAVRLGQEACERTTFENALVLDATALAQFRAGQRAQAIETARRALEVATRQGLTALAGEIRRSLQKYQAATRP